MSKNDQILLEEIIKQEMENIGEGDALPIDRFFEFYSASQILKNYELSYEEVEGGMTGEWLDGGADSIYLFVNGDLIKEDENIKEKYKKNADIEFVIIQSKYSNSFAEDVLLKFSRLSTNLFDLDFDRESFEGRYTDRVLNAFDLFRKTYVALITKKPKLKIKFYYASKGIDVHPNVQKQADDLRIDVQRLLPDADVSVTFVGAAHLMRLTQERINNVFRVRVTENPMSSTGQVFIALVNLVDFYNFITDDKGNMIKHIFESNVRDYQGKTNVNTEIQETLEAAPVEEFWWLNNGVTITASEASAPGGKELVITNPEIVNGLQTSSEIFRYFSNNPDKRGSEKRNILIRVIVPESEETRDKIIRATNSQTPIPKASLRATDLIHRQIEDYMKPRRLYYDRRKNYYKNEGRKPKEIVSLPFLSQCLMSVLMQKPDFARARPSTLLEDDNAYGKLYSKNHDLNMFYLISRLGKRVEACLKQKSQYNSSEIADIKFYVLYATCAQLTSSIYPSHRSVSDLNEAQIDEKLIQSTAVFVYDLYKELGGNDKVAKGPNLSEKLKEKLRGIIGS